MIQLIISLVKRLQERPQIDGPDKRENTVGVHSGTGPGNTGY